MSDNIQNGGIGIFGILGILFIAFKLAGVITWSWWAVLLPFYGPVLLGLLLATVGFVGFLIFNEYSKRK